MEPARHVPRWPTPELHVVLTLRRENTRPIEATETVVRFTFKTLCIAAALTVAASSINAAGVALPAYNVDTSQTTVSGFSSGGYLASQVGYAYSATVKGVGVFTGGPYWCGGHNSGSACMFNASISASMLSTMQADINNWSGTAIDDKANIANQKIYMFVGTSNFSVGVNPMAVFMRPLAAFLDPLTP